jgi:hypothetical protein
MNFPRKFFRFLWLYPKKCGDCTDTSLRTQQTRLPQTPKKFRPASSRARQVRGEVIMIAGVGFAKVSAEWTQGQTAPIRALPFIPSDFAPTASSAGTIVEMQTAVVRASAQPNANAQQQAQAQMLEVLA